MSVWRIKYTYRLKTVPNQYQPMLAPVQALADVQRRRSVGDGLQRAGWLNQVQTTPSGKATTTLATNLGYTSNAGAAMQPTSASIGANGTYTYTASFDADLRLVTDSLTTSTATLYSATRGYDAVGNVVSENTQLGSSTTTDNQLFCYDFASYTHCASEWFLMRCFPCL